jgi:hypothetical protein
MRVIWEKAQAMALVELGQRSFAQPRKLLSALAPSAKSRGAHTP